MGLSSRARYNSSTSEIHATSLLKISRARAEPTVTIHYLTRKLLDLIYKIVFNCDMPQFLYSNIVWMSSSTNTAVPSNLSTINNMWLTPSRSSTTLAAVYDLVTLLHLHASFSFLPSVWHTNSTLLISSFFENVGSTQYWDLVYDLPYKQFSYHSSISSFATDFQLEMITLYMDYYVLIKIATNFLLISTNFYTLGVKRGFYLKSGTIFRGRGASIGTKNDYISSIIINMGYRGHYRHRNLSNCIHFNIWNFIPYVLWRAFDTHPFICL